MQSLRKAGDAGAQFVRTRVKPVVRRGVTHIEPLERVVVRRSERRRRRERLRAMYDELRRASFPTKAAGARIDGLPGEADIAAVEGAALRPVRLYGGFFSTLWDGGDLGRAAVLTTRELLADGERGRARSLAQVLQRYAELRPVGDICAALCATWEPIPVTVWTLLSRNDLELVMRFAPAEYFRYGFAADPQTATASLERVVNGDVAARADAETWVEIALVSFAAGAEDLSAEALRRAEQELSESPDPDSTDALERRIDTLRGWYGRRADAAAPPEPTLGEIPFALVDFKHPDLRWTSTQLADATQTLATLGHLLRHESVKFTGNDRLVSFAEASRSDIAPDRCISGESATVRLVTIDRDATNYSAIPEGTWTVFSGRFMHSLVGQHYDTPLNPRLRPIFVSFRIDIPALSAPGMVDYLRKYAPIGCLDWDTVFLLQAAGIDAFFSGAISATVDTLVAPVRHGESAGTVFVDTRPDGPGEKRTERIAGRRPLAANLRQAAAALRDYRDAKRIVTSDLRCAISARAVGADVEFRQRGEIVPDTEGLLGIPDAEFAAMQRGISDKLAAVFGAVIAGRDEADVYRVWREACAADVEAARARRDSVRGYPKLNFDLDKACAAILAESVTVERSAAAGDGTEINVEFSLDGNYKRQLDVVLDSVATHTSRPVRAFVLCRDHGPDDFTRMAQLFPTVSFVWLPTDNVDYGPIGGMNQWVTPATMDRTILPVLLPDLARIIHFDLDAMCLSDLGELFDVDMAGKPIAAAAEPQPRFLSGFETFRRAAGRLREAGEPALARDLVIRTHAEHPFDFDVFNAGIMVLDLERMRADDFCHRYLPYVQTFGINGQVVLNAYAGSRREPVSGQWNTLIRLEVVDQPKVAHWAGPQKPWKSLYVTGRELWLDGERRVAARIEQAGHTAPAN